MAAPDPKNLAATAMHKAFLSVLFFLYQGRWVEHPTAEHPIEGVGDYPQGARRAKRKA